MFVHTVEYVDFNGNDRKEDLHFHLSLPEVLRLESELGKPLQEHIKELNDNQQIDELLKFLERMLLESYGRKTTDGRSFSKSQEARKEFEHSHAYAELFEQVIMNHDLARRFGETVADNGKSKRNQVAPKVVNESALQ